MSVSARFQGKVTSKVSEGRACRVRSEGRACHARRSEMDCPTVHIGPDKQVPPSKGRSETRLNRDG
jgi:hypothetical protein